MIWSIIWHAASTVEVIMTFSFEGLRKVSNPIEALKRWNHRIKDNIATFRRIYPVTTKVFHSLATHAASLKLFMHTCQNQSILCTILNILYTLRQGAAWLRPLTHSLVVLSNSNYGNNDDGTIDRIKGVQSGPRVRYGRPTKRVWARHSSCISVIRKDSIWEVRWQKSRQEPALPKR